MTPMTNRTRGIVKKDPSTGVLRNEDVAYLRDLSEAMLAQSTPGASITIYLMVVVVVVSLTWAALAKVDEVTKADARVVPLSREQVVSSLEGGILAKMNVREGMVVEKGQELALLDPTRSKAQYLEGLSRLVSLKASAARLRAEATGQVLMFPQDVLADSKVVRDETQAYESRKRSLDEGVAGIKRSLDSLQSETEVALRLSAQGLFSTVELSRLKRQANELSLQIDERKNRYRADANNELLRVETEIAQLGESVIARLDSYQRTSIRSPVRGTVKTIRANTLGSSIPPSSAIMEIVPIDEELLFEARLKPSEVAFVHPGQIARLKLTSYDPTTFGTLDGVVQSVSPDTFRDDPRAQQTPDFAYYRVIVKTKAAVLHAKGQEWPVLTGMMAQVEIRTGEKTILEYVIKPFLKAKDAFRER